MAKARSGAGALLESLAQTAEDRALAAAILARAKATKSSLTIGKNTIDFGPPGDASKYKGWPKSFRAFVAKIGAIRLNDDALVIGEDAGGGLDGLVYLLRGTELAGREKTVRCVAEQIPNWWIYHPLDLAPSGEPRVRFLDHGGGNFSSQAYDHIGSFALALLADGLEIEAAPAVVDDRKLTVKSLGKLHKSINDARVRRKVLFTCERPLKKELWEHYPDATARIAAYDLAKPSAPALLSFLPLVGVPARMVLDGDRLIVLAVDWKQRKFRLYEIDAADPKTMTVTREIDSAKIDDNRNLDDCERDSSVLITGDGRLLTRFYFNKRDTNDLRAFERKAGAWTFVADYPFEDVTREEPFAQVHACGSTGAVVADPDSLWRLFDRNWGRVAIVGTTAVVHDVEADGTAYQTVDRSGKRGKPLRLSKDGLSVELTTYQDFVVALSSRGIDFLRPMPDGSLALSKNLKRPFPRDVIATGGYLVVIERFDKTKPIAKGFCLELCSVSV